MHETEIDEEYQILWFNRLGYKSHYHDHDATSVCLMMQMVNYQGSRNYVESAKKSSSSKNITNVIFCFIVAKKLCLTKNVYQSSLLQS